MDLADISWRSPENFIAHAKTVATHFRTGEIPRGCVHTLDYVHGKEGAIPKDSRLAFDGLSVMDRSGVPRRPLTTQPLPVLNDYPSLLVSRRPLMASESSKRRDPRFGSDREGRTKQCHESAWFLVPDRECNLLHAAPGHEQFDGLHQPQLSPPGFEIDTNISAKNP